MATFTSVGNGNWTTAATWDVGSGYPGAADVAIVNGHTVTLDANGSCLYITNSGTFDFNGNTLTCYRSDGGYAAVFTNTGTVTWNSGTLKIESSSNQSCGLTSIHHLTIASGVIWQRQGNMAIAGNLVMTGGQMKEYFGGETFTVTGTTTISSGAYLKNGGCTGTLTCTGAVTNNGQIGDTYGSLTMVFSSTITNNGVIYGDTSTSISAGVGYVGDAYNLTNAAGATFRGGSNANNFRCISMAGTMTLTSGTMTLSGTYGAGYPNCYTGTINPTIPSTNITKFTGTGNRTIRISGVLTMGNVQIDGPTLQPDDLPNAITMYSLNVISGTYNTKDYYANRYVNLTISAGDFTIAGTYTPNTATTHFSKVGTSTISGAGTINFYALTCSGSTQVNISDDITILDNGELTPSTGGSFVPASGKSITFA